MATTLTLDTIREDIAPYGWTLSEAGCLVSPRGKEMDLGFTVKKGRFQIRDSKKRIYCSGVDAAKFLREYYFATIN